MPAVSNVGPVNGVKPPSYVTGRRYGPSLMMLRGSTLATTATRLYYMPIYIWESRTFSGAAVFNSGTGDSGDTLRVGLYTHGSTNGPTTLVKDFGEITLTAAAAERVLSNSVTINEAGWYWLCVHSNQSISLYAGEYPGTGVTSAGYLPNDYTSFFGLISGTSLNPGLMMCQVDTAYGALASTAVAPTGMANTFPAVWLVA